MRLAAFVENAVGFARTRVDIDASWDAEHIEVVVRDDGPGFSSAVLARLGEPYLTERDDEGAAGGLGLGFFISKTLLERTGAKLEDPQSQSPQSGRHRARPLAARRHRSAGPLTGQSPPGGCGFVIIPHRIRCAFA